MNSANQNLKHEHAKLCQLLIDLYKLSYTLIQVNCSLKKKIDTERELNSLFFTYCFVQK